jgi:hypothetical protein
MASVEAPISIDDDGENVVVIDDDDDQWFSIFGASKNDVEAVVSSRKTEAGKRDDNILLMRFIATQGKRILNPQFLDKNDHSFFQRLASTESTGQRQYREHWKNNVIATSLCTYYMLLKKHDIEFGTMLAIASTEHATAIDTSAAAAGAAAAAAPTVAADTKAKLAALATLMTGAIGRAISDKSKDEGRTHANTQKQYTLMKKNEKKPAQSKMVWDPSLRAKHPCVYCGHDCAQLSADQDEINQGNKREMDNHKKKMEEYNNTTAAQRKKKGITGPPKPPANTQQQMVYCMCSTMNCHMRADGIGCIACKNTVDATGVEPEKDENHRCTCPICRCACIGMYPMSQRAAILNDIADEQDAQAGRTNAVNDGTFCS